MITKSIFGFEEDPKYDIITEPKFLKNQIIKKTHSFNHRQRSIYKKLERESNPPGSKINSVFLTNLHGSLILERKFQNLH